MKYLHTISIDKRVINISLSDIKVLLSPEIYSLVLIQLYRNEIQ